MEKKTTDNQILRFTLATFVGIVGFICISVWHITRTVTKLESLDEKIENVNERVTKITSRNAKTIKELEEEVKSYKIK
jgi:hypothetical protein